MSSSQPPPANLASTSLPLTPSTSSANGDGVSPRHDSIASGSTDSAPGTPKSPGSMSNGNFKKRNIRKVKEAQASDVNTGFVTNLFFSNLYSFNDYFPIIF